MAIAQVVLLLMSVVYVQEETQGMIIIVIKIVLVNVLVML